jgi:hypothetical protein
MSTNDSAIAMILGGMSAAQSSWPVGLVGEPALGAHLVTPRGGYTHHGIYVGDGRVIHYAGFASSWHAGPVEEVTVCEFAFGHWVSIVEHPQARYSAQQVVQRARSRLGECDFRLLSNNCEHFCNWCVSGCHRSEQVERLGVGFCVTAFPNVFATSQT